MAFGQFSPDIGMVFQENSLFPWLTVMGNMKLLVRNSSQIANDQVIPQCRYYLEKVGLKDFENYYPHQLSGGMLQRVNIARSFARRPDILLLDEPFVHLDYQTRISLQQLLLALWGEFNTTIVFVTHDIDEAIFLSDRIVMFCARPATIIKDITVAFPRPRDFIQIRLDERYQNIFRSIADNLMPKYCADHTGN